MPRHSVFVTKLSVHKRMKPGDLLDVSAFDPKHPTQSDLLTLFHGMVDGVHPDRLVDRAHEVYTTLSSIDSRGRTLMVEVDGGTFGAEGLTHNVDDHKVEHKRSPNMAATSHARLFFMVPTGEQHALMFLERIGREVPARKLPELFGQAFRHNFPDFMLKTESVVETDAWLEAAKLDSVTGIVNEWNWSSDLADVGIPQSVGRLVQTLRPEKGSKLPLSLLNGLRSKKITAGRILGFPDGNEPDEVEVQVSAHGRTKTFVINKEKTPRFALVIAEPGDPVPDAAAVRSECLQTAPELFKNVGVNWQTQWQNGEWSDDQLAVRLEVPDQ
ncbi:hypothetical protein OHA70_15460 [Kribbella sp. NBC_00382]|uniref:hypothetical protein n=1 Tax=Kribbella sp. NBC_00382 TaxID=2975967 RepID=UPI002E23FFC2